VARLELKEVHKRYDDVHVVKGVSLEVDSGEFLVLVGPSGCGKSTCLRMIAGLEEITGGEIMIGDRVVNHIAPKDRNIGMVFQSYALYPHMTVRQNLGFGLSLQKVAKSTIDERIDEAAQILGLTNLLERKPKQMSGGQRQRVAIGRAIVKQPQVFLFDEPLSNLDAALRVQMRTELGKLHQRLKTTMVYVTHDQVEAMMLADRIAVLSGGVLQQIGAPLELYQRPANRFVASFIGSPGMNFIRGRLLSASGTPVVSFAGAELAVPGIEAAVDAEVEVGIRPQDLVLGSGQLRGTVSLVEMLGWEAFVHLDLDGESVIARVEGSESAKVRVGENVALSVRPECTHVFDSSGASIWCGADHTNAQA